MNIAIRASFWVITCGGLGFALYSVFKPSNELVKQFDSESKHTDTRKFAQDTWSILKESANQSGELNKKIEELIKKGK